MFLYHLLTEDKGYGILWAIYSSYKLFHHSAMDHFYFCINYQSFPKGCFNVLIWSVQINVYCTMNIYNLNKNVVLSRPRF